MAGVFAVGTLKRGFPLHRRGPADAAFLGCDRTVEPFPLLVAGPWFAPMLLNEPGRGFRVEGELFEVDDRAPAGLDRLEAVGIPGNSRIELRIEPVSGGPSRPAYAYPKDRSLAVPARSGYLERCADRRFIPPEDRPDGPDALSARSAAPAGRRPRSGP